MTWVNPAILEQEAKAAATAAPKPIKKKASAWMTPEMEAERAAALSNIPAPTFVGGADGGLGTRPPSARGANEGKPKRNMTWVNPAIVEQEAKAAAAPAAHAAAKPLKKEASAWMTPQMEAERAAARANIPTPTFSGGAGGGAGGFKGGAGGTAGGSGVAKPVKKKPSAWMTPEMEAERAAALANIPTPTFNGGARGGGGGFNGGGAGGNDARSGTAGGSDVAKPVKKKASAWMTPEMEAERAAALANIPTPTFNGGAGGGAGGFNGGAVAGRPVEEPRKDDFTTFSVLPKERQSVPKEDERVPRTPTPTLPLAHKENIPSAQGRDRPTLPATATSNPREVEANTDYELYQEVCA
jgi:hypothetical protein